MATVREKGVRIRALIRESEFQGEAKWLQKFQFKPLVFPPAIPAATCQLCMNLSNPVRLYESDKVHVLMDELVVGINVMNEVEGSVDRLLSSLSRTSLLSLLVGYHWDLRQMTAHGHFNDAHGGNLLVTSDGDFRWHDFGESFRVRVSQSEARLSELRDHVLRF